MRSIGQWLAYGGGAAVVSYATYVGYTWLTYGHATQPATPEERDALLDHFMPSYEVVERHNVRVAAPADITFAAACEMDMQQSAVVRVVFRAREWIMHAQSDRNQDARGFLSQMRAIGWGVLGEIPSRQIVMGAVTQPWVANPVFRPLPPDEFITFNDPNYVKIVWTLRADPIGLSESVFRTETRAVATDPAARSKFRRYWSFVSAGVRLIRRMLLGPVKAEAERRATGSETT